MLAEKSLSLQSHYKRELMGEVTEQDEKALEMARQIRTLVTQLQVMGRNDLLLRAISVPTLEQLRIEAARGTLSRLIITRDYHIILEDGNREVQLTPIHRAVYLLFLRHVEGIEFKRISEYRSELSDIYRRITHATDNSRIDDSISRLVNPLDNALNEKCSRIKSAFSSLMDEYSASYYIIGSQSSRIVASSAKMWYRRLKLITLPRELVVYECGKI